MSLSRPALAALTAAALTGGALVAPAGASPTNHSTAAPAPAGDQSRTDVAAAGEGVTRTDDADRTSVPLSATEEARSSVLAEAGAAATSPASTTLTATAEPPAGVTVLGLRWSGSDLAAGDAVASMRVLQDGGWGPWQTLGGSLPAGETDMDRDAATDTDWATEGAVLIEAQAVEVELTGEVTGATLETWTTTVTPEDQATASSLPPASPNSGGIQIATREEWGADDSWRNVSPILHDTPKVGITIHHTAGAAYYEPHEVPAILRGIYHYHAISLDWGDIGYNMLLDQHGRLWEGRAGGLERNVQGAHAFGMNRDWFGLSVMGNHQVAPVSPAEMTAWSVSSAWVLNLLDRSVNDTIDYTNAYYGWTRTLPALHGHGEVGLTLCPGFELIQRMDELRARIATDQLAGQVAVQRIGGQDRYEVSARLAQEAAMHGTGTAYLTQGDSADPVDALTAGAVAAHQDAAVLLTTRDAVPSATQGALDALGVDEVVVVGGPSAVSPEVEAGLTAQGLTVRRVSGTDRYETTATLSREMPTSPGGTVYLANGRQLADALGGAAAAAQAGATMLLSQRNSVPPVTVQRLTELAPSRVVLLGGPGAVGDAVVTQLESLLPDAAVDRIGGRDRYETSALVASDAFDDAGSAVLAAGHALPDAMAATQLAADRNSPVLLVKNDCRPRTVSAVVDELGIDLARVAGGDGVIGTGAAWQSC